MIKLKLTPGELGSLLRFLSVLLTDQRTLPLPHQTTNMLVLIDYLDSWKTPRLLSWRSRRKDREFGVSLKLPVAKALHEEMQFNVLRDNQQGVLDKIDHAIINYQRPGAQAHVIGELIG
jgi:hypothetical protein